MLIITHNRELNIDNVSLTMLTMVNTKTNLPQNEKKNNIKYDKRNQYHMSPMQLKINVRINQSLMVTNLLKQSSNSVFRMKSKI